MSTHEVAKAQCPHCNAEFDCLSNPFGEDVSRDAELVSVCLYCARPWFFRPDGTVRKPTPEEHRSLMADPHVRQVISAVKKHGPRDPGRRRLSS